MGWTSAREAVGLSELAQTRDFSKALLAEFLGTLFLVFLGCLSTIAWPEPGYQPSMVQEAIAFGITVATMVQATGHISGGHINPAVTLALLVTRHVTLTRAVCYVIAQCLGGVVGSALLKAIIPEAYQGNLGMNMVQRDMTAAQGFGIETLITFVLVITVFGVCDDRRTDVTGSAPLAIGLAVTTCHVGALMCTGASMNPARSFGPAVVTGIWENHWVFWLGPMLGGLLAAGVYTLFFRAERFSTAVLVDDRINDKREP